MPRAHGIRVPLGEAETLRRHLVETRTLRTDLAPLRDEEEIVFPVTTSKDRMEFEFEPRTVRPRHYTDLLDWNEEDKAQAPRAFDQMGDIVVLKVPQDLWERRQELGDAILAFHPATRAVFHDHGVTGEFRTRKLELIAGSGGSETTITENNVRLQVDVSQAYFSPRLGDERARITGLSHAGERVIDLFGGVAPLGVQLAKQGVEVVSIDLNPAAAAMARQNAAKNKVAVEVHEGDARVVAAGLAPADRVVMNLPHGAKHFLDVAAQACRPRGWVHYHEILADDHVKKRTLELEQEFRQLGRPGRVEHVRHVRAYSPLEGHYAFDLHLEPA